MQKRDTIENIIYFLKTKLYFDIELDNNPYVIGLKNGVYDLTQSKLINDKEKYISIRTKASYNPDLDTSELEKIIKDILPNDDVRNYFLKFIGSLLEANNKQKRLHIFTGGGNNGKSLLCILIMKALGDYGVSCPSTLFTGDESSANSSNSSLIKLKNKRFILASEADRAKKINMAFTKKITGGDEVSARDLYKSQEEFVVVGKPVMVVNDKPPLSEYTFASINRTIIVKFEQSFVANPTKENEKPINENLMEANNLKRLSEQMLNLMIKYYDVYKQEGLDIPDVIKGYSKNYIEESNAMANFVNDNIEKGDYNDYILRQDIIKLYKGMKWDYGLKYNTNKEFINDFERYVCKGFEEQIKIDGVNRRGVIRGYRYKEEEEVEEV